MSSTGVANGAAWAAKAELLEAEAADCCSRLEAIRTRSGELAAFTDGELLDALGELRHEVERVRCALRRLSGEVEEKVVKSEVGITATTKCLTTAVYVSSDAFCSSMEECELRLWGERTANSREAVLLMKREWTAELEALEEEQHRAEAFFAVALLGPELPSAPGSGSRTGLSVASCLEELRAVGSDMTPEALDEALNLPVLPAHVRALQTLDIQLRLQVDCRRLEPKLFENEDPATTLQSAPLVAVDRTSREAAAIQAISFARAKMDRPLLLLPHPRGPFAASEAMRGRFQREITTENAVEGFAGYVKQTTAKLAQLSQVGGLEFELVPGGEYALGCRDVTQRCSLYPLAGSIDHEARLDRRTQYWLLSDAPLKRSGLEYQDGPAHFLYSGRGRDVKIHGYYVQKRPMTVGQLRRILSDRRISTALHSRVCPLWYDAQQRIDYLPVFLNREVTGFRQDAVLRRRPNRDGAVDQEGGDDDAVAEVPYFVAEAIAEALGGVVCPFDVWEAGARGVEREPCRDACDGVHPGHSFLFSDQEAHRLLRVSRKGWCVSISESDGTSRNVYGEAIRLTDDGEEVLSRLKSPFRLEGYGRCGCCEWNAVLDVREDHLAGSCQSSQGAAEQRSRTPMHLSVLQPAGCDDDRRADDDNDGSCGEASRDSSMWSSTTSPTLATNSAASTTAAAAAAGLSWAPTSCDFLPTTHVLRSISDYGTQDIFEGTTSSEIEYDERLGAPTFQPDETFDPKNRKSFVGTALFTFGLPNRSLGGPCAAFRVAIPALRRGFDALQAARQRRATINGLDLDFAALVACLGLQRRHAKNFKEVLFTDHHTDPLYRSVTYRFVAAGFDVTFAPEIPNIMEALELFGTHRWQTLSVVEHDSFRFPIATDRVYPITLPLEGDEVERLRHYVRQAQTDSGLCIVADNSMEFAYVDTFTIPPNGNHSRGGRTLRLRVGWHVGSVVNEALKSSTVVLRCSVRLAH